MWAAVKTATAAGELGWAAKLSRKDASKPALMVFTADHEDVDERERVRAGLRRLLQDQGLTGEQLDLRYKTDEATEKKQFSVNDVSGRGGAARHDGTDAAVSAYRDIKTPCKFFMAGNCKRGSDCFYLH